MVAGPVPDRHHAERLRQILDDQLGAQLVEVEPLHQRGSERARAVEEEAAAVGGLGLDRDEIGDDLALRRQQRGKAGMAGLDLADVGGHQPVEEFAALVARDLDHAAVGKKRCFHDRYLPDIAGKRKALGQRSQGRHLGITRSSDHAPRTCEEKSRRPMTV